ncbi:MAG: sigma-70 family RNA polymerase sigma factor [Phycisphaerae bacterium]|nr:sigma-70 family RNA polymerase sigma factor [Phycisphaerae bacterium]
MTECNQIETWVHAAQTGDRVALAKLLAMSHPRLQARAAAQLDPALKAKAGPEDVLQEVYLEVVRQIDQFEYRGPDSFLHWVSSILDHKLIDWRRAAHCQVRDIRRELPINALLTDSYWNLLDDLYAESGTPSRVVRRQEALAALLTSLLDLSDSHRQVIEMRFLNGLSVGEVAKRLNRSEDAVVALTRRALDALRESMDRQGDFTRGA